MSRGSYGCSHVLTYWLSVPDFCSLTEAEAGMDRRMKCLAWSQEPSRGASIFCTNSSLCSSSVAVVLYTNISHSAFFCVLVWRLGCTYHCKKSHLGRKELFSSLPETEWGLDNGCWFGDCFAGLLSRKILAIGLAQVFVIAEWKRMSYSWQCF